MIVENTTEETKVWQEPPTTAEELINLSYEFYNMARPTPLEEEALLNQLPEASSEHRFFQYVLFKMADYVHDNYPQYEGVLGWLHIKERTTLKNWCMYYAEDLDDYSAIDNLYHTIKPGCDDTTLAYFNFFQSNLLRLH